MSLEIHVDISDAEDELDRFADGVPPQEIVALEAGLSMVFQEVQASVHVDTGSLKGSGKVDSSYRDEQWEGSVTHGGVSTGPNNPVEYAGYEQARDGSHDFLNGARHMDDVFESAVAAYVEGEL